MSGSSGSLGAAMWGIGRKGNRSGSGGRDGEGFYERLLQADFVRVSLHAATAET